MAVDHVDARDGISLRLLVAAFYLRPEVTPRQLACDVDYWLTWWDLKGIYDELSMSYFYPEQIND